MNRRKLKGVKQCLVMALFLSLMALNRVAAAETGEGIARVGGGYAVTGQLENVGYTAKLYDASNGLPTSDANCVLGTSDGYIWIGGYSGVIRYDGSVFERQDASGGLTSARALFEDSYGRLWAGTNDNGVVILSDNDLEGSVHYTYREGLPSSSVRSFAEGGDGTVYIGTTSGIAYLKEDGALRVLEDERLEGQVIERLVSDGPGRVYGCTGGGDVFAIKDARVTEYHTGEELGTGAVTTVYADTSQSGMVYLGTETEKIYYGSFGTKAENLKELSIAPASYAYWITSACDRIFVTTENLTGYFDENGEFRLLDNIPMNNSIDMVTSDYQGNLWFAGNRRLPYLWNYSWGYGNLRLPGKSLVRFLETGGHEGGLE